MGTSSGTRSCAWLSRSSTGSGRPADGWNAPWLDLGATERAARPRAARSGAVRRCSAETSGEGLGLQLVELLLRDRARIEQRLRLGDLLGRVALRGNRPDVLVGLRLGLLYLLRLPFRHALVLD